MVSQRIRRLAGGWSLAELLVVIAVIAILSAIAIPSMFMYLRSSIVRAGAQEMRTALNQAKQLAITSRRNVSVQIVGGGYQLTCPAVCVNPDGTNGQFWTGTRWAAVPVTFRVENNVAVTINTVAPVFTPLGNAAPAGQLRVTGPSGDFVTVTISAAGRITTP